MRIVSGLAAISFANLSIFCLQPMGRRTDLRKPLVMFSNGKNCHKAIYEIIFSPPSYRNHPHRQIFGTRRKRRSFPPGKRPCPCA